MSLHHTLKEETRLAHDRLEAAVDLLRSDLSLEDYGNVLKRFYGIYRPLESALEFPVESLKTPSLVKDLKALGLETAGLSTSPEIPEHTTVSQFMGIRYVLEGSNLGGIVLSRHFHQKFGIGPETGLSFFTGAGERTLPKWKEFLEELEKFGQSKACQEKEVLRGALSTFELLNKWLIHPQLI